MHRRRLSQARWWLPLPLDARLSTTQDADARIGCLTDDAEVMLPGGNIVSGRDQVVGLARTFWEAQPDGRINAEFELIGDDAVVTEGTLSGTHTGTFRSLAGEVPASGNRVSFRNRRPEIGMKLRRRAEQRLQASVQ